VILAERRDAEGLGFLRVALRADAEPAAIDQARRDRGDTLTIQKLVVHVPRHGRPQVRQALGKANQPVELRLLLLRPEIPVIDVLLPSGSVDAGGLELRRRAGRDPDLFPGGRDDERLDPLELFLVDDATSARVDVTEVSARSFASPSPLPRHAPR
jgi:hypothetical protein